MVEVDCWRIDVSRERSAAPSDFLERKQFDDLPGDLFWPSVQSSILLCSTLVVERCSSIRSIDAWPKMPGVWRKRAAII
jgi:hypothetical protein